MFTNKKREGINRFVCEFSLYVAKTSKASIKYHKSPFPIIPFGIVAYGLLDNLSQNSCIGYAMFTTFRRSCVFSSINK